MEMHVTFLVNSRFRRFSGQPSPKIATDSAFPALGFSAKDKPTINRNPIDWATNYPEMRLATVDIPQEPLDSFEQGQVEQSLAKLEMDGVRYALIGASGSAKNGKYYLNPA